MTSSKEKGLTLEERIKGRIKEIDSDERFHYKTATIFENAPLALIQLGMESRMSVLKWILPLVEAEAAQRKEWAKALRDILDTPMLVEETLFHDWLGDVMYPIITELEGTDKAGKK